jgi:undecaprenyl diphosphate synthase
MTDLPRHIVIIPDGNRRWAKNKGLRPWMGHKEGVERIKELAKEADKLEINCLSFWLLSIDNIKNRPKPEINFLSNLLCKYLKDLLKEKIIHEKKIKISILGFWKKFLSPKLCVAIEKVIEATQDYDQRFLNLFIAYNGIDEMLEAVKQIETQARKNPDLKITPDLIKENLFTKGLPPVDYLIRTGGEPHLSAGFMMWDIANAQCYFTKTYFPDFGKAEFRKAIQEYQKRERRLGG